MASQLFAHHRECTWRCRSQQHGSQLASAITKSASISDDQLKIYSVVSCPNAPKSMDSLGRTLLHWAASCDGRTGILEWLMDEFGSEVDARDSESGYTPLHRALLHGQLTSAQALIDRDANLNVLDREGLSPLDIVRRDQGIGPQSFSSTGHQRQDGEQEWFSLKGPTEAYSCGENVTSNLGHRVPKERSVPELVDFFSRRGLSVGKVVMSKWHTAFLTMDGAVYTCGHGSFGRLGHGDMNDRTVPTLVKISNERIISVAVGDEHTVVITANGSAWSWGGNRRRQLGLVSAAETLPSPHLVTLTKNIKDHTFLGCCCSGSYTILWTNDVVYGCGANEGQFGRCAPKTDSDVFPLRQIVGVAAPLAGADLLDIACGETAIAVLTKKFELLLLQDFESRRILSRLLNFTNVLMNSIAPKKADRHSHYHQQQQQTLPSSSLVRLTLFSQGGFMYYWDTKDQQLRNCSFTGSVTKMIYPRMACTFSSDGLFLVTEDGKLYKGRIREFSPLKTASDVKGADESNKVGTSKPPAAGKDDKRKTSVSNPSKVHSTESKTPAGDGKAKRAATTDFKWTSNKTVAKRAAPTVQDGHSPRDDLDYQLINLSSSIPAVHRAIGVSSASDGRNFCVIQQDPKADLVELPTKSGSTLSADYSMLLEDAHLDDCLHDIQVRTSDSRAQPRALHKYILCSRSPYFAERIQQLTTELQIDEPAHSITEFALCRILDYIYTDDFDLLQIGPYPPALDFIDHTGGGDSGSRIGEGKKPRDPIREVLDASKRLNMKTLTKRLETLRWDASTKSIVQISRYYPNVNQRLRFEPNSFPELCDVRLHCKDGVHIPVHRCVLSARAEYFRCMFASGFWSETSRNQTLKVDVESSVLTPVLHYLYTDELPPYCKTEKETAVVNDQKDLYTTTDKEMLEHYGKILVCADQWLLDRLRQLCEIELAARITLRNAADMLDFASAINADQLFDSCSQFISLNLCALLESNVLRHVSTDCLNRVGAYYRDLYPHVGHRAVTPSSEPPTVSDIETVWNDMVAMGLLLDDVLLEHLSDWTQHQLAAGSPTSSAKKKRPATTMTPRARRTSTNTSISENAPETPENTTKKSMPGAQTPLAISKSTNVIPVQEQKVPWGGVGKMNMAITSAVEPKNIPSVVSKPISVPSTGQLPSRPKNKPWSLALSPTEFPPEVSLRDLMQAEEKKQAIIINERRKSSTSTLIRQSSAVIDHKSTSAWTSTSPPSFATVSRPTAPVSSEFPAFSPPSTSLKKQGQSFGGNRAFDEIVKEEKSKEAARTRILNKPLKIIQDEELAMQELALIYQVDDEWDEYITIERAVAIVSEPTWQAHVGSPSRF